MTQQAGSTGQPAGTGPLVAGHPGQSEPDGGAQDPTAYGDGQPRARTTRQPAHSTSRVVSEPKTQERTTVIARGSRLRGGPVLGGFVIGFATWIMLELALFALDLGALAAQVVPDADSSTWWWSGLAAAIGFFVGGLVAGASLPYRRVDDGILNGIAMWAVTLVALIVMSAVGAGIGFGVVGDLLATSSTLPGADAAAINDAQTAAAAALLALAVTLAAAAAGGALGVKMWPMDRDQEGTIDLRQ